MKGQFLEELREDLDHGYTAQAAIDHHASGAATIQARELGRRLRRAQKLAGLDGITLARALGTSESRVSRMMTGFVIPTMAEAAALLALCGVSGENRDRLLDLCHPRHDRGILRLSDDVQWDALVFHAGESNRLVEYQPLVIPWLVQTEEYSAAWFARPTAKGGQHSVASHNSPSTVARLALREMASELAWVELIIHEHALRAPVGDRKVRLDQMRRLLQVSRKQKALVRVVPTGCALPASALSGFTMLGFPNKLSLAFREDPTGGVFFDDPVVVEVHRRIVERLGQLALDVAGSRALIGQIADEFRTNRAARDRPAASAR